MHLSTIFLAFCGVLFQVAFSAPVGYYPYNNNPQMYFTYGGTPCMQQGYLCNQMMQARVPPITRIPILRQKFITITRKHDNLNTAQASKRKSTSVKLQDGPSAEVEGEQVTSVYSKQRGGEHRINPIVDQEQFSQMMPNTQIVLVKS
ncbi:hypothetical protein K7432_018650 [Basidiobolus ranarum]|uniref:Secreted protein n=1 Tax=Basidiobolus ranarum TaxID=34480 RepID=A0ABR2VRI8_9FUNG